MIRVRPTCRSALAAALALGLLTAAGLPASAQEAPSPPISDPPLTVPEPPTTAPDVTAPETTAPNASMTLEPTTTASVGMADRSAETTTTLAPAANDSTTTTVAAPVDGVAEVVTEQVPVVAPVLVELPVHGRGPARVVAGVSTRINALVREAIAVNDEMLVRLNDAQTQNRATSVAVTRAQDRVDRLSSRERRAMARLDAARLMFEDRVRWAYTRGPTASLEGFLQSRTAAQLTGRKAMVQFVLEQDTAAVSRYLGLRNNVGAAVTTASDRLETAERAHARTQLAENEARADAALTTLVVSMWNRARRARARSRVSRRRDLRIRIRLRQRRGWWGRRTSISIRATTSLRRSVHSSSPSSPAWSWRWATIGSAASSCGSPAAAARTTTTRTS